MLLLPREKKLSFSERHALLETTASYAFSPQPFVMFEVSCLSQVLLSTGFKKEAWFQRGQSAASILPTEVCWRKYAVVNFLHAGPIQQNKRFVNEDPAKGE